MTGPSWNEKSDEKRGDGAEGNAPREGDEGEPVRSGQRRQPE